MAEIKGQDVPVIVGVWRLTGKALIAGRARRVVATGVVVGLYSLFPITVSIKGILPHKFCTVQAVCVAVTAAAAGISSLQQIEGFTLASKVGEARLWQVPGAIYHTLTIRKADLVHVVWRRLSRGEAIQPVAPAPSGSALLAVLGWIPRLRLRRAPVHGRSWLFLSLLRWEGHFLLKWERWVYFLLFNRDLGTGQLFLGDGFLRERGIHFLFHRELARGQLLLRSTDSF